MGDRCNVNVYPPNNTIFQSKSHVSCVKAVCSRICAIRGEAYINLKEEKPKGMNLSSLIIYILLPWNSVFNKTAISSFVTAKTCIVNLYVCIFVSSSHNYLDYVRSNRCHEFWLKQILRKWTSESRHIITIQTIAFTPSNISMTCRQSPSWYMEHNTFSPCETEILNNQFFFQIVQIPLNNHQLENHICQMEFKMIQINRHLRNNNFQKWQIEFHLLVVNFQIWQNEFNSQQFDIHKRQIDFHPVTVDIHKWLIPSH